MSLMTRFEHGAIRKGFILEEVSLLVKRPLFAQGDHVLSWRLKGFVSRPKNVKWKKDFM